MYLYKKLGFNTNVFQGWEWRKQALDRESSRVPVGPRLFSENMDLFNVIFIVILSTIYFIAYTVGYECEIPLRNGRKKTKPTKHLKDPVYAEQLIFQMVVILKLSSTNCRVQVQVSSGALHIYGATSLITGVREGVEEIFTEAARSAVTILISTI